MKMSLPDFLLFAVKYFIDVLAWPLLALVYPLLYSVRAIEMNSISDNQKLNAYWVIFSLILLLELALGTLLEWLPFWTYIRLLIVCLLVIPYFDGAFYVYKHLIWPCFSTKPRILISWSDERKESPSISEKIQPKMETYARKNGAKALEEVTATVSKSNSSSSNVEEKDIKAVEVIKKKEVTSAKQGSQAEPYITQIENRSSPAAETKEKIVRVAPVRDLPEASTSNIVQKQWTCPICYATTQDDRMKISHLKGKKHKAAYEALKANNMTSLLNIVPPPIPKKTGKGLKQKTTASAKFGHGIKGEQEISVSHRKRCRSRRKNKASMTHEKDGEGLVEENPNKETAEEKNNSLLKCSICNVSCTSPVNMSSHLRGRMHLAQLRL